MILRPRQELFVSRALDAIVPRRNTLGVAPTGAGKTVMLSAITGKLIGGGAAESALILQHRDELVSQNRLTYHNFNQGAVTGVVDAGEKIFHRPVTFAMVQTLVRNLDAMQPAGLIVTDEAHHSAAPTYQKILEQAHKLNPGVMLLGVTATPNRGDKKALRGTYDNVCDQIKLGELIATGALVKPRTFVVDLGVREELNAVRKTLADYDMDQVAAILDKDVHNDAVVTHWKEKAGDRRTVVFCSTVEHAGHVCAAFNDAGVSAAVVFGEMSEGERKKALSDFDAGKIQVIVNVAVLTEGWDCQPCSCVVLLRPSSYKSTMIQMIGRGLRRLEPERYPGIVKNDCIVLDFGTSTLTHGSLEQDVDLDGGANGRAPTKDCPECNATIPMGCQECPICGHVFVKDEPEGELDGLPKEKLSEFTMTEIELFRSSPFKWEDLWGDDTALCATAFDGWSIVIWFGGAWHAIGGAKGQGMKHLAANEDRLLAIATADDFIRTVETTDAAAKSARWLRAQPSDKQLEYLQMTRGEAYAMKLTRYQAACKLTWHFNHRGIQRKLMSVAGRIAA